MNNTINQMLNRASVRSYTKSKKIDKADLDLIIKAAQQSPTSVNGQQCTVISIEDPSKRAKMLGCVFTRKNYPRIEVLLS